MHKKSEREIFRVTAIVAWEYHEKYSGGGYPYGITGEDIQSPFPVEDVARCAGTYITLKHLTTEGSIVRAY